MSPRVHTFAASDRLVGRLRRLAATHPYATGSIALHALLATLLLNLPGLGEAEQARARTREAARVAEQMASTQTRELWRQVERLEEIRRAMRAESGETPASSPLSGPDSSPAALAARAQAAARDIDESERQSRAARLAALIGVPPAEALRRITAEESAPAASTPAATPAQLVARLERHAREVLQARRSREESLRNGTPAPLPARARIDAARAPDTLTETSTGQRRAADGLLRSPMEQLAAMARLGSAQGRVGVVGSAGGRSVNREGVRGVAGGRDARADDPAPDDLSAPVTARGASIDLTRAPSTGSHDLVRYVDAVAAEPDAGQRALGRSVGRGGIYATRAYVNSWYVIGPFAGQGERSMDVAYPPEQDVDLDGTYPGLDGRVLTWNYTNRGFYPFVPPDLADDAVYYAYTELRIDEDADVWLSIAGDDDTLLWLDGRLVWVSAPGDKPWVHPPFYLQDERTASFALVEGRRRVHLARGVHRVLVKLCNRVDRAFFSLVMAP